MRRVPGQPPLPLLPAEAVPIGEVAGLAEGPDGGVVFVFGLATFAWDAGDEAARRLAAVQLVTTRAASQVAVAAAFGVTEVSLWRWLKAFDERGLAGLLPGKPGPKGAWRLTDEIAARIRRMDGEGGTLAGIAGATGVSTATVRRVLGRGTPASAAADAAARNDAALPAASLPAAASVPAPASASADAAAGASGAGQLPLPVVPFPAPRVADRAAARSGELVEAAPVFTEGAQLPLAGLLLALPGLAGTGLLDCFEAVYGRLRNGFYGLRATVLTMVFLALVREPRAEGATRVPPPDLGRLLGLDRAPEVKTLRRKLAELAAAGQAADLLAATARHHAAVRAEAIGFLHVDGHVRVYSGTRELPKAHVMRMRIAAPATLETWVCDADGDPVLVVTAPPGASLAGELRRLLPPLRDIAGAGRRVTVVFDRGGWSPATFAQVLDAGFDLLTYRKGPTTPVPDEAFADMAFTDPDGGAHAWRLADTPVELPVAGRAAGPLRLRQVTRIAADGHQMHALTSRTDLPAQIVAWRVTARWRQENYFKYARTHFALDALDSYADLPDDPDRDVPNPAKQAAREHVDAAKAALRAAETALAEAIDDATARARTSGGKADVPTSVTRAVERTRRALTDAQTTAGAVPARVTLSKVRPGGRLLAEERKLITHAIRMAAYNSESALARLLRPHYPRAEDEARALLREAFTLAGDLRQHNGELHLTLNPASAPRRTRALAALADQLNQAQTRYPGTDLVLRYRVKEHPSPT